jgi:hypothetical protein
METDETPRPLGPLGPPNPGRLVDLGGMVRKASFLTASVVSFMLGMTGAKMGWAGLSDDQGGGSRWLRSSSTICTSRDVLGLGGA